MNRRKGRGKRGREVLKGLKRHWGEKKKVENKWRKGKSDEKKKPG